MKTFTKLSLATALALVVAAPAFANTYKQVRHSQAMSQDAATAYASAPTTQDAHDPAANASQY